MAKQFNPFHSWLGIDDRLGVPTHYQLLGVKPKADDREEFRELVEKNYKAVAAKLGGMSAAEIGSHQKLHARLVAHVDKARKTLLDDRLRAAYIKSLRDKVRQKKAESGKTGSTKVNANSTTAGVTKTGSTKTNSVKAASVQTGSPRSRATTETQKFVPTGVPKKTSPAKTLNQSSAAKLKPKTTKPQTSQPTQGRVSKPAVPMARPVAKKAAQVPPQPTKTRNAAPASRRTEANIVAEIDQLESKARSEAIMIRTLRNERKKSYLLPILLGAFLLVCGANLFGLFSGSGLGWGRSAEETVASNSTPTSNSSESTVVENDGAVAGVATEANEELDVSPKVVSVPETPAMTKMPPKDNAPADLAIGSVTKNKLDSESLLVEKESTSDIGPVVLEPAVKEADTSEAKKEMAFTDNGSNKPAMAAEIEVPVIEEMPDPVFFGTDATEEGSFEKGSFETVEFLLTRARSELKRGRIDSANEQYRLAAELVGNAKGKTGSTISEAIADGRSVARLLNQFWSEVVRSSHNYTGDDLQPAPGQIIGFVEGRENDVVVKIGGDVFGVPYRSLRPGLAMELASKGKAEDREQNQWAMQQAAFRIVHTSGSPKSTKKIEELLVAAENAESSTGELRRFWKRESENGGLSKKQEYNVKTLKPIVKKLIAGKYATIRRLDTATALSNAIELSTARYKDATRRMAAIDESIKLASHAGAAPLTLDLIDELDNLAEINPGQMKADSFFSMGKRLPRGADPREVADAFYEFIKSSDAANVKKTHLHKLKITMLDFVTEHRMTDLKRLISQSME